MRVHKIEIEKIKVPKDFISFLETNNVQSGDKVTVSSKIEENSMLAMVLTIMALAMPRYFAQKGKHKNNGERILNDLFRNISIEEIEKEIEKEYGIKIETEYVDEEKDQWQLLSNRLFVENYNENEPDYSHMVVKEPNPEYKTWKGK